MRGKQGGESCNSGAKQGMHQPQGAGEQDDEDRARSGL